MVLHIPVYPSRDEVGLIAPIDWQGWDVEGMAKNRAMLSFGSLQKQARKGVGRSL